MTTPKLKLPTGKMYVCFMCKVPCSPRHGDWIDSDKDHGKQSFICKKCEVLLLKQKAEIA